MERVEANEFELEMMLFWEALERKMMHQLQADAKKKNATLNIGSMRPETMRLFEYLAPIPVSSKFQDKSTKLNGSIFKYKVYSLVFKYDDNKGNNYGIASTSEIVQVSIILICIGVLLAFLIFGTTVFCIGKRLSYCNLKHLKHLLSHLDVFSLKHFVKAEQHVKNHFTWLGGFMTLVLATLIITILIISIVDIARGGNYVQTTTVAPIQSIKNRNIVGFFSILVRLYNYADTY